MGVEWNKIVSRANMMNNIRGMKETVIHHSGVFKCIIHTTCTPCDFVASFVV